MNINRIINDSNKGGFTLIELLLTIGITAIIATITGPLYGQLHTSTILNEAAETVIQEIKTARTYASAGKDNSSYGVYFQINAGGNDKVIFYKGGSYLERDVEFDRETILEDAVFLSDDLADDEVNFSARLAVPSSAGDVTINFNNEKNKIININEYGIVQEKTQ